MQPSRSRRLFNSIRWLFLVALLGIACDPQAANATPKVITDADKGGEVHLKIGDTLEVRLKSNLTTGYLWYVAKESTPLMKLIRQSTTEPTEQSTEPNVGRPVFQVFTFEPRRAGDGFLVLHYVRSWEKPVPDEERFGVHVFIE